MYFGRHVLRADQFPSWNIEDRSFVEIVRVYCQQDAMSLATNEEQLVRAHLTDYW